MRKVEFRHWKQWNAVYNCLPYVEARKLPDGGMASWDRLWSEAGDSAFVLESGKSGRFTFAAAEPAEWITGSLEEAVLRHRSGSEPVRYSGAPLDVLRRWMSGFAAPRVPGLPKFAGGIAGYLSYDVARTIERLPALAKADSPVPEYFFMRVEKLWIVDHQEKLLYCAVHAVRPFGSAPWRAEQLREKYEEARATAAEMERQWLRWLGEAGKRPIWPEAELSSSELSGSELSGSGPLSLGTSSSELSGSGPLSLGTSSSELSGSGPLSLGTSSSEPPNPGPLNPEPPNPATLHIDIEQMAELTFSMSKEQYMEAHEAVRRYIAQGDVFQVNLSIRQSRPLAAEPEDVYEQLRRINPSPYMAFLRLPGNARIVCCSPELLVRLEDSRLCTRPIAGTRPRGADAGEDGTYRREMLLSEKERAEHIMLVDLERNDLGKISAYGSVRVNELMAVELYSHVMHIVSEIQGQLAPGKDAFDCIAAVFPGGTITGAPKIRTMEIIEELEPTRRGAYTGAIGWIDYNGNMELNITIRTLVYADGIAYVQSGAGIVIDSDPEKEYRESLNKAKALWKAVERSERRQPALSRSQ